MPKSFNQKSKLLYLMRIFLRETDEEHPLSANALITRLAQYDISCERKSLYDDIEVLRQYGLDIITTRSKSVGYFVASREFELPELKLLVDVVQSSKFITQKKTMEMIKKLEGFCSVYQASQLHRQVFVANRVKTMNESIYYNVDALQQAISAEKKISFQYFEYTIQKEKQFKRGGDRYLVSPYALTWDNENYYLIAQSPYHANFSHFRVDKMFQIRVEQEPIDKPEAPLDISEYTKRSFDMFSGAEHLAKLRFDNALVGVIIDRFGKDIAIIPDGADHFTIQIKVIFSPRFLSWLFSFGDQVTVLSPQSLIDELKAKAAEVLAHYEAVK